MSEQFDGKFERPKAINEALGPEAIAWIAELENEIANQAAEIERLREVEIAAVLALSFHAGFPHHKDDVVTEFTRNASNDVYYHLQAALEGDD